MTPQQINVTLTNAAYKFCGYGSVLLAADYLLPGLYPSLWPAFWTVISLLVIGVIADLVIVPALGNLKSLAMGEFAMLLLIWGIPQLWGQTGMTLWRAVWITVAILPLEYALHRYVLRTLFSRQ